jgi:hypothetical protein
MGGSRERRSGSLGRALAACVVLALCAPATARAGEEIDPEEDPSLRPPDVAALDLATMGDDVDLSDENWDGVETDIPKWLEKGQVRTVLKATRGRDTIVAFALRPSTGLLLHRDTLRRLRALRAADPVGFNVLVARHGATARLIDRLPKRTVTHECASAYGHLAHQGGRMIGGDRPELDVVKTAVATLVRHDATLKVSLGEWKEIVLPALALGRGLGDEALTEWALGEMARVTAGKDADPDVKRLLVILDLEKGTRLAATDPAAATPILARAFAALSAKDALPAQDETLLYHYNAAVTAAKLAGIPTKADWRMRSVTVERLKCEFPLALGWTVEESPGQELSLRRHGSPGRSSVHLLVERYDADTNYRSESGKTLDGDSISMILKDRMEHAKPAFARIEKEAVGAGRLSRTIQPKGGWELVGDAKEGKRTRMREWGFKTGKSSERFLVLRLTETSPTASDPELDRVLDSLAERK